ncbi:hypothetical protein RFM68_33090 [Mesorhizobium sp. MSK_1335]|uniref:Uncharacterized protein n=1 Tax=Mesorhizobium montanum TaxID=3072323 RepID=A0ABU4ZW62_9HYPH|nr:hypothetical protein [Mesorhizobium sp. MSK_1335]MDX8529270.1 hypothetical protein [Mesorhizobium sp. MSK_1335]
MNSEQFELISFFPAQHRESSTESTIDQLNLEASVRSVGSTEPLGTTSDLIASRIERSRGQDWRYGDCSPELWPG